MDSSRGKMIDQARYVYGTGGRSAGERSSNRLRVLGVLVNLSAQDLIVISTALVGAIGNAYLFVAAVHDGHRGLYRAAREAGPKTKGRRREAEKA
jgi:hypothetical protein